MFVLLLNLYFSGLTKQKNQFWFKNWNFYFFIKVHVISETKRYFSIDVLTFLKTYKFFFILLFYITSASLKSLRIIFYDLNEWRCCDKHIFREWNVLKIKNTKRRKIVKKLKFYYCAFHNNYSISEMDNSELLKLVQSLILPYFEEKKDKELKFNSYPRKIK